MEYLFVYGTLLRSFHNAMTKLLGQHSQYVGKAYTYGYLYDVGHYPAFVPDATQQQVMGELYQISSPTEQLLSLLDDYEDTPHLYSRQLLTVHPLPPLDSSPVKAWVYCYEKDIQQLTPILSGDYLLYIGRR